MNILTHPVHTGYQFDLARTGHEYYSLDTPGVGEIFWDSKSRPEPKNYHRLKKLMDAPVNFDLILVHYQVGYHSLKQLNLPLIFKEHCLRQPFKVPADWIDRVSYFSFASQAAAARWELPAELDQRKVIIGMGMDLQTYRGYVGKPGGILTVGQNIRSRGNEKGKDNLLSLSEKFPITVVGRGNEGIPGAVGPAEDYAHLLHYYQTHRVFLNPSNILGMSTLEAMATGMPVVTFRMLNSNIICQGKNGFVVDTVKEAASALRRLLEDGALAQRLGKKARATIKEKFPAELFVERWNTLFRKAVYEYHPRAQFKKWKPFDIASKPTNERLIAGSIVTTAFEYCRVGHDKRRMTFLSDGRVGEGAAGCEVFWDVKLENGHCCLEISSGGQITCRLKRQANGSWSGRWIHYEKMPIVLAPLRGAAPSSQQKLGVVALIAIRNEEQYLDGYFKHLRDFVDGFIVFDDNSTDRSLDLVKAESKVLSLIRRTESSRPHFFEIENRKALLTKAYEVGAKWVLCCDADERFEQAFLIGLNRLTMEEPERCVMALRLRALWNSPDQYRVDGIYADRHKYVLFPCIPVENYYSSQVLHRPWYPPALDRHERKQILTFNLYHLKSIDPTDRIRRYEKFKTVDPCLTGQPEGYEHLIEERDAVFERIPDGREYDA